MKRDDLKGADYSRVELSERIRNHNNVKSGKTIQDVIDTMNDEQKMAVECIILCMIDDFTKGQGDKK